ncbi:MAG: hypothetical protein HQL96_08130, partial [Magnetococcales bacterium]|nr:hypothetical protein [Magnetococcales bacterium]
SDQPAKLHDDNGHGNDADGVDDSNPALAKKSGDSSDTTDDSDQPAKLHDDNGHGNDADGVDDSNPALAKSDASSADMEENFASNDMLFGNDSENGASSQAGHDWLDATETSFAEYSPQNFNLGNWMDAVDSDFSQGDSSYSGLMQESGQEQGGSSSLLEFEALETVDG